MALDLVINGEPQLLPHLAAGASLAEVLLALGLKADRIAVERNGDIEPRTGWAAVAVQPGDRLEVVHFVGGGTSEE